MQVAAMNPIALDETQVSQEVIDRELEIERDILTKEGKPANIIDNILKGKMQKFYKENTLVHQAFIKDGGMSVADFVKSVNGDLKVTGFKRLLFLNSFKYLTHKNSVKISYRVFVHY